MYQYITHLSLLVRDYDEAIIYYTEKLDFELLKDIRFTDNKRWVLVRPRGENSAALLLARADNLRKLQAIGNQSGGRVFLFLNTDDFWGEYKILHKRGVKFTQEPREANYENLLFSRIYMGIYRAY